MKKTPWYRGDQIPARDGWYERDHRNCTSYIDPKDRIIWLDYWMTDPDNIFPGEWYVVCPSYWFDNPFTGGRKWIETPMNDASEQRLPWRGLTEETK